MSVTVVLSGILFVVLICAAIYESKKIRKTKVEVVDKPSPKPEVTIPVAGNLTIEPTDETKINNDRCHSVFISKEIKTTGKYMPGSECVTLSFVVRDNKGNNVGSYPNCSVPTVNHTDDGYSLEDVFHQKFTDLDVDKTYTLHVTFTHTGYTTAERLFVMNAE